MFRATTVWIPLRMNIEKISHRRGTQFVPFGMPTVCWNTFPARTKLSNMNLLIDYTLHKASKHLYKQPPVFILLYLFIHLLLQVNAILLELWGNWSKQISQNDIHVSNRIRIGILSLRKLESWLFGFSDWWRAVFYSITRSCHMNNFNMLYLYRN